MIEMISMLAAVPLSWMVTPQRPQPVQFDRYHGETLEFRCEFSGFEEFAGLDGCRLWYQTNGMGAAWWSLPADFQTLTPSNSQTNYMLKAVFPPEADPGAERLSVFFGAPSNAYAAAQVRFRNSPGATPNELAPPAVIDWAAELLALSNSLAQAIADVPVPDLSGYATISNTVVSRSAMIAGGPTMYIWYTNHYPVVYSNDAADIARDVAEEFWAHEKEVLDAELEYSFGQLDEELQAVSNEAQVVYRLFSGSNVVMEVTNYNSQVHAPELRILQLGENNGYFTVWTETNGLAIVSNSLAKSCALAYTQALETVKSNYAPRAWSRATSGLGAEAPSNTTWISTPTTVIAGGLEYAKVVHANGEVWVLSGNGMMEFDPTTNAYLRISADDGTEIFSIEKTDALTVGAWAEGIEVDGAHETITIPVPVVSTEHPKMYWRESLESGGWADESEMAGQVGGSVEWTGGTGTWVCTVSGTGGLPDSMFFKFTYEQPGGTVIRNSAAVDVSGGIMCTDGIHKVRPVYNGGSISWEVVP